MSTVHFSGQTDQIIVWMAGAVILLMALVGLALLRRQGR